MRFNEEDILNFIYERSKTNELLRRGIGDDCALIGDNLVVSVDTYVEDVHFKLKYFKDGYKGVGRRCVLASISDIYGVGGEPKVIFLSISVREGMKVEDVEELYRGLEEEVERWGGVVGGGDIVKGKELSLTVVSVGTVEEFKGRDSALPQDLIYISGHPGLSETGRMALEMGLEDDFPQGVKRFLRPEPHISFVRNNMKKINALMDVSDGLSLDLSRLLRSSGRGALLYGDRIPLHEEVLNMAEILKVDPLDLALSSGEDYMLLSTSPFTLEGGYLIGEVTDDAGMYVEREGEVRELKPKGYIHGF